VDMSRGSLGCVAPVGGGRTFGARSATTGSPAVRSVRGRWPSSRRRCYRLGLRWPVGGPRKTYRGRLRASSLCGRPTWGDCRQCPLTALGVERDGGKALNGLGRLPAYQPQSNSECRQSMSGSQFMGDKIHEQEGNSPDQQLRSLNLCSVEKDVGILRQLGGWLRSSNPVKKA